MSRSKSLKIAFDPVYILPLPEGHRFPMIKYELIPEQLVYEGTIKPGQLISPAPCPDEVRLWTHDKSYLDKLHHLSLSAREQRQIGFPQSPELVYRELMITQGTINCCYYAFENGVAINVAGGTHHAFADHGEGFCVLNDFAVAANYLLQKKLARQILIIDLDVHQGNGTVRLFENTTCVFTFSMHGDHNYPFHKEKSDLDIALKDGTGDADYLALLENTLHSLLPRLRPDFVFYLSAWIFWIQTGLANLI